MSTPELEAELAIRKLIARYCHCFDDARVDEYSELFTLDGEFHVGDRHAHSREQIRSEIASGALTAPPAQHVTYNSVIEVEGDRAHAETDFMYLAREPDGGFVVSAAGRYIDEIVREADAWRFRKRVVRMLGEGASADASASGSSAA